PTDALLPRGGDEVARPLRHDALEVRGASRDDRDEMDDGVAAGDCAAETCRIGDVALDELDAERDHLRAAARSAHERADGQVAGPARVDEARGRVDQEAEAAQ